MPLSSFGSKFQTERQFSPPLAEEASYQRSFPMGSKTMGWECPVAALVPAKTRIEALSEMGKKCVDLVLERADSEPHIYGVLNVELSLPLIEVVETKQGYFLKGSFFLEALVFQKAESTEN